MEKNKFKDVGAYSDNPKWDSMLKRENDLYTRKDDIRTDFMRDW